MPSSVLPLQPSRMLVAKLVALTTAWSAIARLPLFTNEPPASFRAWPRAAAMADRQAEKRVMEAGGWCSSFPKKAALDRSFHSSQGAGPAAELGGQGGRGVVLFGRK